MHFFYVGKQALNLANVAYIDFWADSSTLYAEVTFVGAHSDDLGRAAGKLRFNGAEAEKLQDYINARSHLARARAEPPAGPSQGGSAGTPRAAATRAL